MIVIILFVTPVIITCTLAEKSICCTPEQWEASMYWDNFNVFLDKKSFDPDTAYSYINGSLKTAYDFTNQRTFISATITEISPLIPTPIQEATNVIKDFKNVSCHTLIFL